MKLSEDTTPDLVKHLAEKLEYAYGVVNELVHVYEQYTIQSKVKYDYNIDKAYKLDIEIKHQEDTQGAPVGTNQRGQAGGSRGGQGVFEPGSTTGGGAVGANGGNSMLH